MLLDILKRYLELFPEEREKLVLLLEQVEANEKLNNRRNFRGHITGAGIVLSPDHQKVLLIHHKAFNRWQQPGGHWEDDEANPLEAAKREVMEEAGIEVSNLLPVDKDNPLVPLDIDTHFIPVRPEKNELEHYHHDFRYVFVTQPNSLRPQVEETLGAEWCPLDDPRVESIAPTIAKLQYLKLKA